ncbi:helix-turn-helix domain-containing protein [Luteipulveratus mongoliensis]|uniref:helix-turn-helix domain-containing protein n=1 Tax=Luteipulveratus mongoliensis TaxID=571913 RepID=UPI001C54C8EF|nr:AraC family transcriptional regulator [Luteipulveratus mongoliensis]
MEDHLLWCVLDGVGRLEVAGHDVALRPGVCFLLEPGDAPVAEHDPHRRLLVFGIHFETPDDVRLPHRWCATRDFDLLTGLARLAHDGHRRGDVRGLRQAVLGLEQILLMLHDDATRPTPSHVDTALADVVRDIRGDPGRRWTVPELATRTGLSRSQLTRRFTTYTGLPPARFVAQARVARARELIVETDLTVSQVATVLGYSDLGHFSRQYQRHTGRAPGADGRRSRVVDRADD